MFFSARYLFKLLTLFLASIRRIPSVRFSKKRRQAAWTARSTHLVCPGHMGTFPPSNGRSVLTHFFKLLPIICYKTSPMPIGGNTGHLSNAIRQESLYEFKKFSSLVAFLIANLALFCRDWLRKKFVSKVVSIPGIKTKRAMAVICFHFGAFYFRANNFH